MPKHKLPPPTDAEILAERNVSVELVSRYIGSSTATLYNALRQERAPFGFAAENPETGTWAFNISPGLLVKYKRGELPVYRLDEVIHLAADGVEQILNIRLQTQRKLLDLADTALNPGRPGRHRRRPKEDPDV